jgi:hypothetical protein
MYQHGDRGGRLNHTGNRNNAPWLTAQPARLHFATAYWGCGRHDGALASRLRSDAAYQQLFALTEPTHILEQIAAEVGKPS